MDKFNKEDFPLLFKSVSMVLGDEEAENQLSIAYKSCVNSELGFEDTKCIGEAFEWMMTLQGYEYWRSVSDELDFMMKVAEDE